MDSNDKMMIHHFIGEEDNVTANDEEHLTILVCLLQFQADKLHNAAHACGGSKSGRRNTKKM
jgi:hypothetical protein